jgi:uncharacterized protein with HEPN domain
MWSAVTGLSPTFAPPRRPSAATAALHDIAHHIDLAVHFAAGFDDITFRDDPRTVYAVTRCLEIIPEASDVAAQHVWDAVQIDLPPLRAVIAHELAALDPSPSK